MPSSIAVQSSLPSSHAARRALRGLENTTPSLFSVSRALREGRGKEEPLSAIAMVLQAAPGDDDLPPPGPPPPSAYLRCSMFDDSNP